MVVKSAGLAGEFTRIINEEKGDAQPCHSSLPNAERHPDAPIQLHRAPIRREQLYFRHQALMVEL
jgi:hypothetical protein